MKNLAINEKIVSASTISGGDINAAWFLQGEHGRYFLKLNAAQYVTMFACEYRALLTMSKSLTLACPQALFYGTFADRSYLLLEFIEFCNSDCDAELGVCLADFHSLTHPEYGWQENNFIGTTAQINTRMTNWCDFWLQCRLHPQWQLAAKQGYSTHLKHFETPLFTRVETLLRDHHPKASLLHGDLWSGNKACYLNKAGKRQPVIFDPACYYGDRETDLALSRLFGGFSTSFYEAYERVWPLTEGHQQRCTVYQLYHMLNHLNLFGEGYLASCQNMIARIIDAY